MKVHIKTSQDNRYPIDRKASHNIIIIIGTEVKGGVLISGVALYISLCSWDHA